MQQHQDVIAEVMQAPDGPQVGALFDFDGTLISGYSAVTFIQEQVKRGNLSVRELMELVSAMVSFGIGRMGFSAMMIAASQFLRGIREDSYANFGQELFESDIARLIYPESRALVQAHLAAGERVQREHGFRAAGSVQPACGEHPRGLRGHRQVQRRFGWSRNGRQHGGLRHRPP